MSDRALSSQGEPIIARYGRARHEEKCPYCDGTGIIAALAPDTTRCCTRCDGRGWVASCLMESR